MPFGMRLIAQQLSHISQERRDIANVDQSSSGDNDPGSSSPINETDSGSNTGPTNNGPDSSASDTSTASHQGPGQNSSSSSFSSSSAASSPNPRQFIVPIGKLYAKFRRAREARERLQQRKVMQRIDGGGSGTGTGIGGTSATIGVQSRRTSRRPRVEKVTFMPQSNTRLVKTRWM